MKKDRDKTCHEKYGQMIFKSECFKTNNSNFISLIINETQRLCASVILPLAEIISS